ncbi:MAG: hypothetical protein ACPG5B_15665 [Chitinophagales bacterium]
MADKLFQLIHALSKSEKRYFNKFANMNRTESNLLKLFEAICKQKKYDEAAIKKKFTGEKFATQLFVTKKHLYDAILKSMRLYNSERSVRYRLQAMLQDIQYLYEKQLFEACNDLIAKAKQIAEQHEMFYIGLQLLYWHDKQMVRGYYKQYDEMAIEEVSTQFNLLLEKLKRERAYRTLETKMGYSYFYLQEAARLDFQEVIINNSILHDENYALSNKAKLFYYSIHTQYYYARLNWEKVYMYQKKMVLLLENDKSVNRDKMLNHVYSLNNFLHACLQTKRFEEFEDYIPLIKAIPKRYTKVKLSDAFSNEIFPKLYLLELLYYNRSKQEQKGKAIVLEIEKALATYKSRICKDDLLLIYVNVSLFYFSVGLHKDALLWLQFLLNANIKNKNNNMFYNNGILLQILLHFELEHHDLLEHLLRAAFRFFYKKKGANIFEISLLQFVKKSLAFVSQKQEKKALEDLQLVLGKKIALAENEYDISLDIKQEILFWLNRKLE